MSALIPHTGTSSPAGQRIESILDGITRRSIEDYLRKDLGKDLNFESAATLVARILNYLQEFNKYFKGSGGLPEPVNLVVLEVAENLDKLFQKIVNFKL